jgi:hypothetical protein
MTFFARLLRKLLGTPRYHDDFSCSFDPSGTILRAGDRGGHSLAFYFLGFESVDLTVHESAA